MTLLHSRILLGKRATGRMASEMAEKYAVGTVFSSVKSDLFSSSKFLRPANVSADFRTNSHNTHSVCGILASVSMPFNMVLGDDDLKKLFLCVYDLREKIHESEFCVLFAEWLVAQINRSSLDRRIFLLKCINSVSLSTGEGLNTHVLKNMGVHTILSICEQCTKSTDATVLMTFLALSMRDDDPMLTTEMKNDILQSELRKLRLLFRSTAKSESESMAERFRNLIDISRVTPAKSEMSSLLEDLALKYVTTANLKNLVEYILILRREEHRSAYENLSGGDDKFSPSTPSEFELTLRGSIESSAVLRLADPVQMKYIKQAKEVNAVLTVLQHMHLILPKDVTVILKLLLRESRKVIEKSGITESISFFWKLADCLKRTEEPCVFHDVISSLMRRISLALRDRKNTIVETRELLEVSLGVFHLSEIISKNQNISSLIAQVCADLLISLEEFSPDVCCFVARALRMKEMRHAVLAVLPKNELFTGESEEDEKLLAQFILKKGITGDENVAISILASLRQWNCRLHEGLVSEASKKISIGRLKNTVQEVILCLQTLCEHRHVIHIKSVVVLSDHLLQCIEELSQSDIIHIIYYMTSGRIKYDKLTDVLYVRMTNLPINEIEAAQLLACLFRSSSRKINLAEKYGRIALKNPLFFPFVCTVVENLGLSQLNVLNQFALKSAPEVVHTEMDLPKLTLLGGVLRLLQHIGPDETHSFHNHVALPLSKKILQQKASYEELFVMAAILTKCHQLGASDDILKGLLEITAEHISSASTRESSPARKFPHSLFASESEYEKINKLSFRQIPCLNPAKTYAICTLTTRHACEMFHIFGGSITLARLSDKNYCSASALSTRAHMEQIVPSLEEHFHVLEKDECVKLLLTIAFHRWRTASILPKLLRSFVSKKWEFNLSTVLVFRYAIKMLRIVDNKFLRLTRISYAELLAHRAKNGGTSVAEEITLSNYIETLP